MSEELAGDRTATRYLLGRMTDEESAALEQKMLVNREVFDEVMAAEDDLIDEYLEGGLPPDERLRFERVYLSAPDRRARVEFARALREKLGRDRTPAPSAVPSEPAVAPRRPVAGWLAAAAALFAAVGVYFALDGARLRSEVGRLRRQNESASRRAADVSRQVSELQDRSARLERDLESEREEAGRLSGELALIRQQGSRVVSFLLSGGAVRGDGQLPTLTIPADVASVRVSIPTPPGAYASYRAVIQTPEGKSRWAGTGTWPAAGAKALAVTVPASSLPAGDYILSLTGVMADGRREPAADFSFRVKRG